MVTNMVSCLVISLTPPLIAAAMMSLTAVSYANVSATMSTIAAIAAIACMTVAIVAMTIVAMTPIVGVLMTAIIIGNVIAGVISVIMVVAGVVITNPQIKSTAIDSTLIGVHIRVAIIRIITGAGTGQERQARHHQQANAFYVPEFSNMHQKRLFPRPSTGRLSPIDIGSPLLRRKKERRCHLNSGHPIGNGLANFIRGIFLDKMVACDSYFGLIGPTATEFSLRPNQNRTRFCIDEQLGHVAIL